MVLEDLCILCCTFQTDRIEIFSERGIELNIAATLSKHFWFEVKVVQHYSRVICARCWTLTKDFHTFYQSIEQAQTKFNNDATTNDVPTNGPTTNACTSAKHTNCNNNDTQLKAKFLHGGRDAVSLNIANATILTTDKSLSPLNENYELSLGELAAGNNLVNNNISSINDDVVQMEMQLEDGANESGTAFATSSKVLDAQSATINQSDDSTVIASSQSISTSPTACSSSDRALSHQIPIAELTDITSNSQAESQNLPQFSTELTNLIVLNVKATKPINVSQTLPSFSVLQSQYAPVPDKTEQISLPKSRESYSMTSNTISRPSTMLNCNNLSLSLNESTKNLNVNRLTEYERYNPDNTLPLDILPVNIAERPPSTLQSALLEEVEFDFPFRMDELYKTSPSTDSGYSPSQSTSSGLTPQYFRNSNHSFDLGMPSALLAASTPREPTETSSTRLPSFSDVCSSYSGSIYSVDSGHPNDSPTQLLNFNDAASQYSVTSPCSGITNDSPMQLQHLHDVTFEYSGSTLLTDCDISLDLDHFINSAPSFGNTTSSNRNPALDAFNDASSGCLTSYENLLKASEMPLKLPQVTDADLKQTLPPTNEIEAGVSLSLDDGYSITAATYSTHSTMNGCRDTENVQENINELVEITKVTTAVTNPFTKTWKNTTSLSTPMQFPSVEKPIISIYPIPSAGHRSTSNRSQNSAKEPAIKPMVVSKSLSIEAIPFKKELNNHHVDTNNTLKPDFEIRLVNVNHEPSSAVAAISTASTCLNDLNAARTSYGMKMPKTKKSEKIKERKKFVNQSLSPTSDIHPINLLTPSSSQQSTVAKGLLAPNKTPFTVANIQTIEFSSNQHQISLSSPDHHPSLQWETSSGKLQLLSETLPRCQVILERLDINNSGCSNQDLNTVQNIIPKQYTPKRIKNRRFNKGTVDLQLADEKIQTSCTLNCENCQMIFTTVSDLLNHYQDAHNTKGFIRCCKKKYYHRGPLLRHIKNHGVLGFRCELCNKSVPSKRRLKEHLMEKHLLAPKKLNCNQCTKHFDSKKLLDQHIVRSHSTEEEKNFVCDKCGRRFSRKEFLTSHIKRVHNLSDAHVCEICSKVIKTKADFKTHQLTHVDAKLPKLQCQICDAQLKNDNSMRKHMKRHNDTEHTCLICNRVYFNQLSLNEHMRYRHSGCEQACTMCDKVFRTRHQLKEHMTIHTGEIMYKCPYCPKTMNCNSNMYKHKKLKHPIEFNRDRGKKW